MLRPNERLAILSRIKKIARKHSTFRAFDCMCIYHGLHYSDDWEEGLNYLVEKGKLTTDSIGNYSCAKADGKAKPLIPEVKD